MILKAKILLFIISTVFMSSCVPYPHYSNVIPKLTGYVYVHNQPVVSATLLQSYTYKDEKCMNVAHSTQTDAKGYFEFPMRDELKLVIPFGDAYYYSYLCLDYKGVRRWIGYLSVNTETNLKEAKYSCEITKDTRQDYPHKQSLPFFICNLQ